MQECAQDTVARRPMDMARQVAVALLLAAGVYAWWTQTLRLPRDQPGGAVIAVRDASLFIGGRWVGFIAQLFVTSAVALAYAALPTLRRALDRFFERLRRPSADAMGWATVGIFLGSLSYLFISMSRGGYLDFPYNHDEYMFLVQTRMLSTGRLWMPQHPLNDFFETFHVLGKPVYAALQFPGTSLMYVPTIWLGIPYWVASLSIASAVVVLIYRIVTELIDGLYGAATVVWMLALRPFTTASAEIFSQLPLLLLVLGAVWCWLRWRAHRRWPWALAIGALLGWAAITRPVDAAAWGLALGAMMLSDLWPARWREWPGTIAAALAGATPFLLLQLVFNVGVTGSILHSPGGYYNAALYGDARIRFGFFDVDPQATPSTHLPQQHAFYRQFILPSLLSHRPENAMRTLVHGRLPMVAEVTVPTPLMLALLPVGLLGLCDRRFWVLFAPAALILLAYVAFPSFVPRYSIPMIPAVLIVSLLGVMQLGESFSERKQVVSTTLLLMVVMLSLTMLPELNRGLPQSRRPMPTLRAAADLPGAVQTPAVVLFRYRDGDDVYQEPVYNIDTPKIDDAPIIRAHDLGPQRNHELVEYYARHQPERNFYLFDRRKNEVFPLGKARELMEKVRPSRGER